MADKSEILEEIEKRVGEAHSYLGLDQARDEMTQLESRAASPDLWDNQEEARPAVIELLKLAKSTSNQQSEANE